jgi:voltage-gated potassium channel
MVLILLSLGLLVPEVALPRTDLRHELATELQEAITVFFILELGLRCLAMKRRSRFFKEYWLDILAVLPVLRAFRIVKFFRLLRLLRLIRLASLLTSNSRLLQNHLQRSTAEYILTSFFLVFSVLTGTFAFAMFENPNSGFGPLQDAFWVIVFSVMSGQYEHEFPGSLGGRFVILGMEFCSLSLFAVLTGTISAVMVEKIREGGLLSKTVLEDLEKHVLVCGWNSGVEIALLELQLHPDFKDREYIVIADRDNLPEMPNLPFRGRVRLMRDDFTRAEVLQKANVANCAVALIVSDINHNRTRQDADARTVLCALTIEKLNPAVYTCAELSNSMNEPHLRMGNVNEVVITQDIAGHLIAQAALSSGQLKLLQQMVRPSQSQTGLNALPVPDKFLGRPFRDCVGEIALSRGAIPLAVMRNEQVLINPDPFMLQPGDVFLCVGNPSS